MDDLKRKISGLYAIIDLATLDRKDLEQDLTKVAEKTTRELVGLNSGGGAGIVQLRAKQDAKTQETLLLAKELKRICKAGGALFIINDRADIALLCGADGVHLGQDNITPEAARKVLGNKAIIGLSTHTIEQAKEAAGLADRGIIDYISFGPVFATGTKRDASPVVGIEKLKQVTRLTKVPVCAIGGITQDNLPSVIQAGAAMIAMISEVLLASDIPEKVKALATTIESLKQ